MLNGQLVPATSNRGLRWPRIRTHTAGADAFPIAPAQIDNGDEALYADKSGTYTKGVLQSGIGLVDLAAYQSFKNALSSGAPADFEKIVLGGPRTLNGPQGGLAFYLACPDASSFAVPPAPALASEAYATELVELILGLAAAGCRFHRLSTNPVAKEAAAELAAMPAYTGPRNAASQVTPELLFRGGLRPGKGKKFCRRADGPYFSQFLLQPTALGALPITQNTSQTKAVPIS